MVTFMDTGNRVVVAKGLGPGEAGSYYLRGTEFQFGKMEEFWRWTTVIVQCEYS